jgi:uncharacterized membrane protein
MIVLGVLHFVAVDAFAQIVPPALPSPRVLVWISGVVEIVLGLALIAERTRRIAGLSLVALYMAVFPANVYMAAANVRIGDLPPAPPWLLWARLPLQVVFIAWALWASRTRRDTLTNR